MAVLIGYAGVREGDFFDRTFETFDADAVVDLEKVPEDERKAAEEVGSEFFGRESEYQTSDSRPGEQSADVYADEREDEYGAEPPDDHGRGVFEERKELFGERARFEDLGESLVEHDDGDDVREPKAREARNDGQGLVRYGEVFVGERSDSDEEFPADGADERMERRGGREAGDRSE